MLLLPEPIIKPSSLGVKPTLCYMHPQARSIKQNYLLLNEFISTPLTESRVSSPPPGAELVTWVTRMAGLRDRGVMMVIS